MFLSGNRRRSFLDAHHPVVLDNFLKGRRALGFGQRFEMRTRLAQPALARVIDDGGACGLRGGHARWWWRCGRKNGGDFLGDGFGVGVVSEVGGVGECLADRRRSGGELGHRRGVVGGRRRWYRGFHGDARNLGYRWCSGNCGPWRRRGLWLCRRHGGSQGCRLRRWRRWQPYVVVRFVRSRRREAAGFRRSVGLAGRREMARRWRKRRRQRGQIGQRILRVRIFPKHHRRRRSGRGGSHGGLGDGRRRERGADLGFRRGRKHDIVVRHLRRGGRDDGWWQP